MNPNRGIINIMGVTIIFLCVTIVCMTVVINCSTQITDMVEVVCHHAVVDEEGIQSDIQLSEYFIPANQLDDFIALMIKQDQTSIELRDEVSTIGSNSVPRQLVRIRTAPAVLEVEFDNSNITTLKGSHLNWKAVWTIKSGLQ